MQAKPEDYYLVWKNKLADALKGDATAREDIKQCSLTPVGKFTLAELLVYSRFYVIQQKQTIGPYELYSLFPSFLLLQGAAEVYCINLQGDTQTISTHKESGIIKIDEAGLRSTFGESNMKLVTKFEIFALERCLIIELIEEQIKEEMQSEVETVNLREECIMKKYMLFSLKTIEKFTVKKDYKHVQSQKIYLLEGMACFYQDGKDKFILSCYEEGYFDGTILQAHHIKLHIFLGSTIMVLEEEFLRDQFILGLETKRKEHLLLVMDRYNALTVQERRQYQIKLAKKYKLDMAQVDRCIYKIEKPERKVVSRNSMPQEKCGIRIRKTKKILN